MSLLQTWLEKKAYNVQYTGNTREVPELLDKFKPDIVLVDQPQLDSIKDISAEEKSSFAVILMTGYTTRYDSPQIAVDEVIEKPFHPETLEKLIQKHTRLPGRKTG